MKLLEFIKDYSEVFLILISCFAIFEYVSNRRNLRKSTATIVYNQLKDFDTYIEKIKNSCDGKGTIADYHLMTLNCVFESNLWNQNKHMLLRYLNQEDIRLIEKAYGIIENLEVARKRIIETFMTTNNAKSFALQFKTIELMDLKREQIEIENFSTEFNKQKVFFSMAIPHDVFMKMLQDYEVMSGTTTMEKLRKLSYKNRA